MINDLSVFFRNATSSQLLRKICLTVDLMGGDFNQINLADPIHSFSLEIHSQHQSQLMINEIIVYSCDVIPCPQIDQIFNAWSISADSKCFSHLIIRWKPTGFSCFLDSTGGY